MTACRPLLAALLCGVLAASLSLPAAAQWKWRDKDGRITVSDLPPPREVQAKDILQRPEAPVVRTPAAAAPASAASAVVQRPAVDNELQARKKAENCRAARAHLAALDSGQRIARYKDNGEREILDDQQRAGEARRARDVIASDCR